MRPNKKNPKMKVVPVNMQSTIIKKIEEWRRDGIIPNRSEFIRQCVLRCLPDWEAVAELCYSKPTIVQHGRPSLGNNYYIGKVHEHEHHE